MDEGKQREREHTVVALDSGNCQRTFGIHLCHFKWILVQDGKDGLRVGSSV